MTAKPATTKAIPDLDEIQRLQEQERQIRADAEKAASDLAAQREALHLRRRPALVAVEQVRAIAEAIKCADAYRAQLAAIIEDGRERMDRTLRSGLGAGSVDGLLDLPHVKRGASFLMAELDSWMAARRIELAEAKTHAEEVAREAEVSALVADLLRTA